MGFLRISFSGYLDKKSLPSTSLTPSMFSSDSPHLAQVPENIPSVFLIIKDGTLVAFAAGALGRKLYCSNLRVSLIRLLQKIMHF